MSKILACLLAICVLPFGTVYAQTSSPNFSISEAFVGSGGQLDSSSASFQAKASVGDLTVGFTESAAFEAFAGFTTTDQPYLEFYVDATDIAFGNLSDGATATGTAQFYVRSYLTSGYVVTTLGPGLISENLDQIDSLATPTASTAGTEQFGMNLVANTTPAAFGANPVQVPDASFSYGVAATDYNTTNQYKYAEGDTIASSPRSTGQTNFTASYIANISAITEAGLYQMEQVYIATATF
ncbi:MAG: hypothetical protein AAF413_01160 [Patescibacteria group bacterium]